MKKKEQYLLLKFKSDYADEFDVKGFIINSKTEWEEYKKYIETEYATKPLNFYFGTNQNIEFSIKEYFNCITVILLSDKEYKVLNDLFPNGFGIFPIFEG